MEKKSNRTPRKSKSPSNKRTRNKRKSQILKKRANYEQDIQDYNKHVEEIDKAIFNQHLVANTFCFITLPDMIKYNLKWLNDYFQMKSNECVAVETGNPLENKIEDNWILQNDSCYLILIMKYNLVELIQQNPTILNQPDILKQIVGHAIIQVDIPKKMIGIFNVCSHRLNESGHGVEIMNSILLCIEFRFSKDYTVWLGILMNNKFFEKVAKLYTSVGFQNPYIHNTDYFGNIYRDLQLMFLTKDLEENMTEESIKTNYNILMHMFKQHHGKKNCTFQFQFDHSILSKCKLIPFLSIGGGISAIPMSRENYPEYGGSFSIVNSKIENGNIIFKMGLGNSNFTDLTVGSLESVNPPVSLFNFHIHPYRINKENGWIMNPPSPGDFSSIFNFAAIDRNLYFHTLIAMEGIYVISLSKTFIDNYSINNINEYKRVLDRNYFYTHFVYDTSQLEFSQVYQTDLEKYVKPFLEWFEETNKKHHHIFEVQYFSWNTLKNKDLKISIHYLSTENKACHMNQHGMAFNILDPNFMHTTI